MHDQQHDGSQQCHHESHRIIRAVLADSSTEEPANYRAHNAEKHRNDDPTGVATQTAKIVPSAERHTPRFARQRGGGGFLRLV